MIRLINKWFLRQSIRKHGVLAPILVTEDGQILDGNTRAEIARELGILIPVAIIPAVHKWMDPQDLKITSPISNRPGAKDTSMINVTNFCENCETTARENAELHERIESGLVAMSIYQRDIKALRERVAALEALTDSVGILCEEMYGAEHLQPFPVDMIPEAAKQKMDAVLDAWGKTNELGALLYEQPRAFYAVANNLLETKADLWRKMADEGGQ